MAHKFHGTVDGIGEGGIGIREGEDEEGKSQESWKGITARST